MFVKSEEINGINYCFESLGLDHVIISCHNRKYVFFLEYEYKLKGLKVSTIYKKFVYNGRVYDITKWKNQHLYYKMLDNYLPENVYKKALSFFYTSD